MSSPDPHLSLKYIHTLASVDLTLGFFVRCRSSLNPNLYKPTFAGFVDIEIAEGKISLRSLVQYWLPYVPYLVQYTSSQMDHSY